MRMKKHSGDIISSMFFSAAVAMIFTQVAGYAATMIDGVVSSRALGPDVYSAISLLGPFTGVILLLGGAVSAGSQVVISSLVGVGKKEEANATFAAALLISVVISALLLICSVFFPGQLFSVCGVSPDQHPGIYPHMLEYLQGYRIGIPVMMAILILGPMIVMDNDKELFVASAFLLCGADAAGDLINAYVLKGGAFGMGLASAIAFVVQGCFLLTHFFKKNCYFRITFKEMNFSQTFGIIRNGMPTFVRKAAITLRDLLINRINLMVALSTAAIAARGMQNDLLTLLYCIGLGIGKTMLTMAGVFYSADDRRALTELFSCAMKLSVKISGTVGLIALAVAPALAGFYTRDPEVARLAVISIRCMAVVLVADTLFTVFQNYLQAIENRRLLNIMNLLERLLIPVLTALVMGVLFGSEGVMASVAVGNLIPVILMFGYICLRCKGLPGGWKDFMFVPESFGGSDGDNLYAEIRTMEDVMTESRKAEKFCLSHGIQADKAKLMGLFVEELAGNVIEHGVPVSRRPVRIDFRLHAEDGGVCLSLRDNTRKFDPAAFCLAHASEDPEYMMGIRMVTKLAKDFRYFNTFNSNNVILHL